jgi:uncharacterized protein (DUF302 family)
MRSAHISYTTRKRHADACEAVRRACESRSFSVLALLDLGKRLTARGVDVQGKWTVFEVCNPRHAQALLAADALAKVLLPCRISVHTAPCGATRIEALRPTSLVDPTIEGRLMEPAARLDADLEEIVGEAGRPASVEATSE